jgi:major vault protein
MITLLPNDYIVIKNPVLMSSGAVLMEEKFNQAKLRFGIEEVRTGIDYTEPFPLYPGEEAKDGVHQAIILGSNQAIKLYANWTFEDPITKTTKEAGSQWLLRGPLVYYCQVEASILENIEATIIKPNTALRVQALYDFYDPVREVQRRSGEEWLIREFGAYIPSAEETIKSLVSATILTDVKCLKLRAKKSFVDIYKKERKAGEEWLVTNLIASSHICDIYEEVVQEVMCVTLNRYQYCVVIDPYDFMTGKNAYGMKELRKGEDSFFLQPGEVLQDNKICVAELLAEEEALLLTAIEKYEDEFGVHLPGQRWMVPGPRLYIPDIPVKVLERRNLIPLDEHEGIYVRDIYTGKVRMVTGASYMLNAHEELWSKELSADTELLLSTGCGVFEEARRNELKLIPREKFRVVTYTVQHNSAVQVFDYNIKQNKIYFGPQLIKLGPYEEFTVLKLSGDVPKQEDRVLSLELRLGPDYMNDAIEVETSDHARLYLKLTYSWKFNFDRSNKDQVNMIFNVKDFVGDCCKSIASRVRGAVSSVNFDSFHKDSSNIVQNGVFGKDKDGNLKKPLYFKNNLLSITNVDIQSQEPIDSKTRDILNGSMKLSMETNLKIQEAEAKHREERASQDAKGKIERKKLEDDTANEEQRLSLLMLKNSNDEITSTGVSVAEAKAKAEENEIKTLTEVEKAKKEFEAEKIKMISEMKQKEAYYKAELAHLKRLAELEVDKLKSLSESQISKIKIMVEAIGQNTLVELAKAGPETQASILGSLGVKSMIFTDGKNPINLFNTAAGLLGNQAMDN